MVDLFNPITTNHFYVKLYQLSSLTTFNNHTHNIISIALQLNLLTKNMMLQNTKKINK